MRIKRDHLGALFNRLSDHGHDEFVISHPASEIGDLARVRLGGYDDCTVEFLSDRDTYDSARREIERSYPDRVYKDLPTPDDYLQAVVASGIVPLLNKDELEQFLQRHGDPDLMAGHPPVVAGFDTNVMPWQIDRLLGLHDTEQGLGYVNGFVLATGVRDELDWEKKCHDTGSFVDAFGDSFEEYWNQSLGAARIGRLGLLSYRRIRDVQEAVEIQSDDDDESIIAAYDEFNQRRRNDILLFSNDRNFVERARAHRLFGKRIEFPDDLPVEANAEWRELERLLYFLAILFGVVEVPSTTVHGVWRGKDSLDWQYERLKLDCRSPKLKQKLEGDLSIVESYEELHNDRN